MGSAESPFARRMTRQRQSIVAILTIVLSLLLSFHFWAPPTYRPDLHALKPSTWLPSSVTRSHTVTLVAGRKHDGEDSVAWVDTLKHVTNKAVYVVDDLEAPLHIGANHGRESRIYLRYILDNYDNLDDITIFVHGHDVAAHHNILMNNSAAVMLDRLNLAHVDKLGYFNLRCDLETGCPRWIKTNPTRPEAATHNDRVLDWFNDDLWARLFPDAVIPPYLAAPCCSQFAVSRATLRAVPLEQYERIFQFIVEEGFDQYSGRVMEYVWHYLFTGQAEMCTSPPACYCAAYGLCDPAAASALATWDAALHRAADYQDDFWRVNDALSSFEIAAINSTEEARLERDKARDELEAERNYVWSAWETMTRQRDEAKEVLIRDWTVGKL